MVKESPEKLLQALLITSLPAAGRDFIKKLLRILYFSKISLISLDIYFFSLYLKSLRKSVEQFFNNRASQKNFWNKGFDIKDFISLIYLYCGENYSMDSDICDGIVLGDGIKPPGFRILHED